MKHLKRVAAIIVAITVLSSVCLAGSMFSASASGTGAGLAQWAMNAYYSGWAYVYGGSSPGAVDCSGLIYSYAGGNRTGDAQLGAASESGSVYSGIPRVHGLGLYEPGHVGVYVGNGMAVDARNESEGVCYSSVDYMGWTTWFKLSNISYPTTGWEEYNGSYYYYENGEYIVNTSRTIDGVTYYFGSDGISDTVPNDTSAVSPESGNSGYDDGSSAEAYEEPDNTAAEQSETAEEPEETEAAPKYETLQLGSEGEGVTKLQQRLQELGFYTGEITGYFDEETYAAYVAFQTAAGVTVDGISGESDQELLYSDSAPCAPEETEPDEETVQRVLAVQNRLAELYYYTGDCDGIMGNLTVQSIMNFQLYNNFIVTGELDEETYAAIMSEDAEINPDYVPEGAALQPTAYYEYNAYEMGNGIMGPSLASESTNSSSFILPNALAQDNAAMAGNVAAKTNQLAKNAVSSFASQGFETVGPLKAQRINGMAIGLIAVLFVMSLMSVYVLVRARKEKQRKAARAAVRAEKKIMLTIPRDEPRYWW